MTRLATLSGRPMWQQLVLPEQVVRDEMRKRIAEIRGRGGYDGARTDRRAVQEWSIPRGDAQSLLSPDLDRLRDRSRDLERNDPIAAGAIATKVTNVIGAGFLLVPEIDREATGLDEAMAEEIEARIGAEWELFGSAECDITRTSSFNELCAIAYRAMKRDGDVFVLLPAVPRPGSPYATKIQLVDADRVSNPDFASDDSRIAGGVERDPMSGEVLAYHFADSPTYLGPSTWARVPAFGERTGTRRVLHLFEKRSIAQVRGIPDLAAVIEPLHLLRKLSDSELMASVISSMFTVFIKTDTGDQTLSPFSPTAESGGKTSDKDYKLGAGAILGLADGESVEFANPQRPSTQFDPFVLAILRQIGMGLELPFEMLVKHFTASYSAARAAMVEAWKYFIKERRRFARQFAQPIYERFLIEAIGTGRIEIPGFVAADIGLMRAYTRAQWIGPARGAIDEGKEVAAADQRVASGYSTREEETAALTGGSWRKKLPRRRTERRLEAGAIPAIAIPGDPATGA